jgi:hypothetical protein
MVQIFFRREKAWEIKLTFSGVGKVRDRRDAPSSRSAVTPAEVREAGFLHREGFVLLAAGFREDVWEAVVRSS